MVLDSNERSLFCELIVQLTVRLVELSAYGDFEYQDGMPLKGREIDDEGMSAYQAACEILVRSGVVDRHPRYRTYKVKFGIPEMRTHLAEGAEAMDLTLSPVLESFLQMTGDFGSHQPVDTRRVAFSVPTGFDRTFELLCRCGYAQAIGDKVNWTDKIEPMMITISHWE